MVKLRPARKTKRLFINKFRQVGTDNNGRPILDIYFKSKNGAHYVWTPSLNEGTLRLFQIACQVKTTKQHLSKEELENRKKASDYISLAIKVGKALHRKTSLSDVQKVAKSIFTFDLAPRVHFTMPDIVAQEIYDWIITLGEQPIDDEEKMRLIRKFTVSLNSVNSSVESPAESQSVH